jgi:hypothetical protein
MGGWIGELAEALRVDALADEEESTLLATARDVAHGVERRVTPLAAFLAGAAVERRMAAGASRDAAMREVLGVVEDLIPGAEPGAP